ncbi:MAG TPA: M2 family metallopeptidase [Gemmatimonadota bacterium]|nr:M2 family metallopeptidase [Gemmatimonadota bacterium]
MKNQRDIRDIVEGFVARLRPLETAVNRAWWDAAVTGESGAYGRLEGLRNEIDRLYLDPALFDRLGAARSSGPEDPLLARTIELLYLEALPRQVDPALGERINRLATGIEREFSTYRPVYRGEERTANDLDRVLKTEADQDLRREAWEALKAVGSRVAPRLHELVGLRNEAARSVGYPDFYHLRIALLEQRPDEMADFLDRLDALTGDPFRRLKADIDAYLGERRGVAPGSLQAWHYGDQFFQEMPDLFGADLDGVYARTDIVDAAHRFFDGIGLPVAHILARSSLHEAPGKDPHAFAIDVDREGDVRILLNLRPNERWMGTTLHELGHAVYDDGIDRDLPWILRRPAHTLTTEAIAMLFGRLSRDSHWMREMGVVEPDEAERLADAVAREIRATMLVFARWVQVMARFERDLYADPDQDLNALWWSLVERFQGVRPPPRPADAADYAAKIHVVIAPVYYHNYLLGECFASQIDARLRAEVLNGGASYSGRPAVGAWLTERIFRSGARDHYDALARSATGEAVGPGAMAAQFFTD